MTLRQLCLDAGVRYQRVYRWKQGGNATARNLEASLPALEAALAERERRILQALSHDAATEAA